MYQPIDYDDLHRRRPYLKTHEEAMRVCMETEARHAEGSPEYLAGMLEAFQKEKEAMGILRAMPEDSPYKEREWARMHRGTAVMAQRAGQTEEAAYWAEEGLARAYDAVVRDELFELLGRAKPERLMELFRKRLNDMNWETSCFQELEPEAHTPQNAVACLSELIAMLEGDGEMYRAFGYELVYLNFVHRRLTQVKICLALFKREDDNYSVYHEFMLDELEMLSETEIQPQHFSLFAFYAASIYFYFAGYGASEQTAKLLDKVASLLDKPNYHARTEPLLLYFYYVAQGIRVGTNSQGAEYWNAAGRAVEELWSTRQIAKPEYLKWLLTVRVYLSEHYLNAGKAPLALEACRKTLNSIQKRFGSLHNSSIEAQFLYANLALNAAKAYAKIDNRRRRDIQFYSNKANIYLDKCSKQSQTNKLLNAAIQGLLADLEKLRNGQPVEQKGFGEHFINMMVDAMTATQPPPAFAA